MNPGEPPADTLPREELTVDKQTIDELTVDDALDEVLALFDEELAAGRSRSIDSKTQLDPTDQATPEARQRLDQLRCLLLRLEQDRQQIASEPGESRSGEPVPVAEQPDGDHRELGRFQIISELGHGGWGIVFLAWDPQLRRHVALKVPRPEALLSSSHRRRFVLEAQAVAGLDHPGIVPVYEAGEIGPIWYIASAYFEGHTLAKWLARHNAPVPPRRAAELVTALAEAMDYTHGRGIVHRDLKPSNILLPFAPSEPDELRFRGFGQPKITDFGLAKLLEQHGDETRSGLLLGTPAYMAPEQAEGKTREIGPATDIYALGVILYELLTGQKPYAGQSDIDTLRQIAVDEPITPARIRPGLPRDLEAICLKCLEKAPARRYAFAGELALDLRRFLDDQPTLARPLTRWQRAGKWSRRRPAVAALLGVVGLAAMGLPSLGAWYVTQLRAKNAELRAAIEDAVDQRSLAEQGERKANRQAYAALVGRADDLRSQGQSGLLAELLVGLRPEPGKEDLREFAWHYLWRVAHQERFLRGHRFSVNAVAFSPDGTRCVSGGTDQAVKLWDVATGTLLTTLLGHTERVVSVAFSPDGTRLATASRSLSEEVVKSGEVILWDAETGQRLADMTGPMACVNALRFASDGQSLLMAGAIEEGEMGGLVRFELSSGQTRILSTGPWRFTSMAISADGRYVATACGLSNRVPARAEIHLVDLHTEEQRLLVSDQHHAIECLAFSPQGEWLAAGGLDVLSDWQGTVRLWDLAETNELPLYRDQAGRTPVKSLVFSPDDRTLWVNSHELDARNSTLRRRDVGRREQRTAPKELAYLIGKLVFSPDDRTLALACSDHLIRLWEPESDADFQRWSGHTPEAWSVAFAPDDATLASAGDDHLLKLWDPSTGKELAVLKGHKSLVSQLAFSPDGRQLASVSYDQTVRLWDAVTGESQVTFEGHAKPIRCVAFSPDGRTLASAGKDQVVKVWDLATRLQRFELLGHSNQIRGLAFSPDGRTLVSASEDRTIRCWDTATGEATRQFDESSEVWTLAFSPDGHFLATGNKAGIVKVWDFFDGSERSVLRGHGAGVRSITFSPDGRTLASGSGDRTIRLWHPETGHELLCLADQPHEVNSVAFARDGQTLVAALHDGSIRLYTAPIEP